MKADDTIAGLELCNARAGLHDGTGQFVTQNLRRLDEAVVNLLDVGAANAARRHPKEHFSRADFRNRHVFDDHATLAAVDAGAHLAAAARLEFRRSDLRDGVAHMASASALASSGKGPDAIC